MVSAVSDAYGDAGEDCEVGGRPSIGVAAMPAVSYGGIAFRHDVRTLRGKLGGDGMPAMLPGLAGRRGLARLCTCLAVVGVVVAAGRPSVEVEPAGGILGLVVDVSVSTQADDLSPTRFQAIQQASLHLLDRLDAEVRVGLVSISTSARTLVRPTTDHDAVHDALMRLQPSGGTAMGDALQRALDDIQTTDPAAPARVLLLSDGANSTGSHPSEAAGKAATRNIPILAVAVGTPTGKVRGSGPDQLAPRTFPPDLIQLASLAGQTGGRAVEARSSAELMAAVEILGEEAGVVRELRELTLLVVAVILVLIAGGVLLSGRPVPVSGPGRLLRSWRWAPVAVLVAAAAGTTVVWFQWQPIRPGPGVAVARLDRPSPVPPEILPDRLPAIPPLTAFARTSGDRRMIEQAGGLLRRHGELYQKRGPEIARRHLNPITALTITVCDRCGIGSFADTSFVFPRGTRSCDAVLNLPEVKRAARQARVPVTTLTALAVLHEQELCLAATGGRLAPYAAEQRLARKLGNSRLFDLLYVQVVGGARDTRMVWQAAGLLRDHGELAVQRDREILRLRLQQVGPLLVEACRSCIDALGSARVGTAVVGIASCEIKLDMTRLERTASEWGLPLALVTASTLVHEQGHCVHLPDDREAPAADQEMRLARKLGNPRLVQYVASYSESLDGTGH
jgi:Ca-activated chloride channel family protein